jgi:hypothetical protein
MKTDGPDRRPRPKPTCGEPVWAGSLLVLVDDETNNLGETIAAVLRQRKQALLIGAPTRGGAVRYETVPVDAEWSLRFARAEVLLADDSSVFKKGLKPDFAVSLPTRSSARSSNPPSTAASKAPSPTSPAPASTRPPSSPMRTPNSTPTSAAPPVNPLPEDEIKPSDLVLQRAVDLITARARCFSPPRSTGTAKPLPATNRRHAVPSP